MAKKFAYKTRCQNEVGWYTVIAEPVGKSMTVKYDDGTIRLLNTEQELPHLTKPRSSMSEACRIFPAALHQDGRYWAFLGFLAANSNVDAHIPESQKGHFMADYHQLTGISLDGDEKGFTTAAQAQWGFSMRIYFPSRAFDAIQGLSIESLKTEISDSTAAINNKRWIYELFQLGFRVSVGHDVEKIRASIPPEHVAAFDSGMNL